MKTNISTMIKGIKRFTNKYSPEILMGLGASSMIGATIFAIKATPKAVKIIEEEEKYKYKELTKKEIVQLTWKEYIPVISLSLGGLLCLVGSCRINGRRTATFAAAYSMSERAFSTYRDKVVETIGERKEKKIRNDVGQDEIDSKPASSSQVIITPKGNTLIMDSLSSRYFRSDLDTIKKAVNELNRRMNYDNYISVNDFYSAIGLETVKHGDRMGWNLDDGLIEMEYGTCLADNDEPCIYLDYSRPPKPNFDMMY